MKVRYYKMIWGLFLCFYSMSALGQSKTISGTVTDATTGESIPGTNIRLDGTSTGTISDIDGNYKLTLEDSEGTLVFSFIGYKESKQELDGRSVIDVAMEIEQTELDEIVVIGYGTQRKKVTTGAIASVSNEEISALPVLRAEQAMQGRTPGVQVTNLSGQPGESPTVRIRGTGTTGDATPLFIVDGMQIENIDYLNPNDIESIDVLKDAASAAIYGARAANGVVLITTKSGEKGKMSVTYSGYYGIQNAAKTLDLLNAEQYRMIQNEGARNAGRTEPFDLNEIPAHDTDWQSTLFETNAPISNHQIQVMGGGEKSTYAASLSVFSQEGIIGGKKSKFDRFTARINSTHLVNRIFTFGNNFSFSHIIRRGIDSNSSFNGAYNGAINMDPLTPLYETDADILNAYPYSGEPVVTNESQVYGISQYVSGEIVNPLALLETQHAKTRVDKFVGNVTGEVQIIEGLKFKTNLGIDLAYVLDDSFKPLYFLNGAQNNVNKTSVNKEIKRYYNWQWENTLSYSKQVGDHNIGVLLGTTAREENYENLSGFNADLKVADPNRAYLDQATDTAWVATGGATHAALASLFGRVTYDYKSKYSLTAIVRRDGSSKFGPNNRYGIFPSLGLAWVASDEAFLQNLGPVNLLKFRFSWGINGNDKIEPYQFLSSIDKTRGYTFGGGRATGSSPSYIPNPDIKWEESEQLDFAIDLGLFENKLTATIDAYRKTTHGLLEIIPSPPNVGNGSAFSNAGSVQNEGIEMSLNWRHVAGDVKYSIGVNGAYNKNKITKIANDEGIIYGATWAVAGYVTQNIEDLPIAYFYGYKTDGLFQNQSEVFSHIGGTGELLQPKAQAGDVRFVDVNGDGVINDDDRTNIGNPTPTWTFGMTASVDYKGLDFSMLLTGSAGNDIFNGLQRRDLSYTNTTSDILNRWTGEGTSNSVPRYTWTDVNNNNRISDLYIEDGSYVRIKNIQIGYSLPISVLEKVGASNWRVYVSAENLFTFTKYSGADPEIGANPDNSFDIGIDRGIYPQARTFRFGTSITF